jgi:two-component system, chemotaxis family, CheB/CheR fusion protein
MEAHDKEPIPATNPSGGGEAAGLPDPADGLVHPPQGSVPVVGLGGSAGSLAALIAFVSKIPEGSGAAYVIVMHLSPEHECMLAEILQHETTLPVDSVNDSVSLEKDRIYVISPGKQLSITDGILKSIELKRTKGRHVTIDTFFRSLAEAHGVNATAIILSGADADGSIGLTRVKERGGLTIAQDPSEAEFDGMPSASIATGMVDWILPAAEMPARLSEYWSNGRKIRLPEVTEPESTAADQAPVGGDELALRKVLEYLKARCGHDFSSYKRATVLRRLGRRMQVNGTPTLADYLAYMRIHPGEIGALMQDLLISVTSYFRDRESYLALESVIPSLFNNKTKSDQVRVWVPACATGEEAYSIAILLCEYAEKLSHPPSIQIFATDLDQNAIAMARKGIYLHNIAADVPEERLKRFFTASEGGYRVKREIRDMILFAMHDLLKDPPFSRLDLVSCRNLLIYLNRDAQGQVFDIFHFALRPEGKLFLGNSENVEEITGLFEAVDKKHRLYVRKDAHRVTFPVPAGRISPSSAMTDPGVPPNMTTHPSAYEEFKLPAMPLAASPADLHLRLIERLAPPSIVVNRTYDIVHLSRSAGKYLKISGGEPSANLLKLIHPKLRTALRTLLSQAPGAKTALKCRHLTFEPGQVVNLSVEPVDFDSPDFFLVMFEEQEARPEQELPVSEVSASEQSVIRHLEEELDLLRLTWRSTVEQYEASGEELKASNEELQAMNEELRSATEELETGREELQSINEELITINQELKVKVEELGRANSDLQNLMASTKIATIFLDREMRIKRFTPSSTEIFNFIPSDQGRPLADLTHNLDYPTMRQDATGVLADLNMIEREVKDMDGKWFLIRMSPYRTTEDKIAGVVITFIDITERKKNAESQRWLSAIVESSSDAIMSFTMDGNIISWNKGAERVFGYSADEIVNKPVAVLAPESRQDEASDILRKLREGEVIESFETERLRKDGKTIDVFLSVSVMRDDSGKIVGATEIGQDISVRIKAVRDLRQARDELEEKVKERTAELRANIREIARMASALTLAEDRERRRMALILHDDFQQVLVSIKMSVESLHMLADDAREAEIGKLTKQLIDLIADSRSLAVDLSPPILSETLGHALYWLCMSWMPEKHHLPVNADIDVLLDARSEDIRSLVFHSVRELLFNVVKHSTAKEAFVNLTSHGESDLKVTIRDHGLGFDPEAEISEKGKPTGYGLIGMRERIEMLGGSFTINSRPNEGVEAVIIVPRKTEGR